MARAVSVACLPASLRGRRALDTYRALDAHCPKDAKAIDAALERSMLGKDEQAQIKALRDEGMTLHDAGDHRQAEGKLAEAMRMLLGGGLK